MALQAEHDENACRKDFTPSEKVEMGRALEEAERALAKQRQSQAVTDRHARDRGEDSSGNFPELSEGQTRDKVGEAVGMSGKTYEVEMGRALEDAERALAKQRQQEHGGTAPGKPSITCGNFPQVMDGKTRDKVGEAVGMSGKTYEVEMGRALEDAERALAKQRQSQAGPSEGRGAKSTASGKFPEAVDGQTRDKVGEAVALITSPQLSESDN